MLEASDRIGGRVFTKQFADVNHCELGTSSSDVNSVPIPELDAVEIRKPSANHPTFIKSNGRQIDTEDSQKLHAEFAAIQQQLNADQYIEKTGDDNLYNFLSSRVNNCISQLPREKRPAATRTFCSIMQTMRLNYGTELINVGAGRVPLALGARKTEKTPANGCSEYLSVLCGDMPPQNLRLGTPVVRIEWNRNGNKASDPQPPILVRTAAGESLPADYVISTLPLGVLRHLGSEMFDPPMTQLKQKAVDRMGLGTVEKIFLEFAEPLDDWFEGNVMYLARSPAETFDRRHWTSGLSIVHRVPNSQHVLEISVAGKAAEEMRMLSAESVALDVHEVLTRFRTNKSLAVPLPKTILRSNWSKDARFLGSHVFPSLQTDRNDVLNVQRALYATQPGTREPRVLFAGDSTAEPPLLGTFQGAQLSGIREANRIVRFAQGKAE